MDWKAAPDAGAGWKDRPAVDNVERRRTPRLRTYKGGSIIFGTAAAIECLVRNLSESGAALELRTAITVPDTFTLVIKPEFVRRECRVVWRSRTRLGVEFVRRGDQPRTES